MSNADLTGFADGTVAGVERKVSKVSCVGRRRRRLVETEPEVVETKSSILNVLCLKYLLDL